MESSDSSSDDELNFKDKKTIFGETKYDHHISFRSSTATSTSFQQQPQSGLKKSKQISGSRFRIVPLESCYERGRWACWDFYNTEPTRPPRERHNSPLPLFSSSSYSLPAKSCRNICKSSLFSPIDDVPHTAPANDQKSITFSFDFSDESDIDSRLTIEAFDNCKKSQQSSTHLISQNKTTNDLLQNNADNQNKPKLNAMETELARGGRMTQVEMLNSFGLERSLTATYNDNRSILELLPRTVSPIAISRISNPNEHNDREKIESSPAGGTVVTASGTGANTPVIAIDGKIEQAMDLVKTHLMFAVREEVDVLRAKIMELEATILQLEAENAILREHVPVEILNKLSLQTTPTNSTATTSAV